MVRTQASTGGGFDPGLETRIPQTRCGKRKKNYLFMPFALLRCLCFHFMWTSSLWNKDIEDIYSTYSIWNKDRLVYTLLRLMSKEKRRK